jgi:prepilin-type N-terminal cleavage/methylation domain-containing protein
MKSPGFFIVLKSFFPRRNKSSGFTLIELVLSLALAAVLAAVLGGVLRGAVGTWRDMRDASRARQRAQALYDRLGRDLRNSLSFPGETFKGSSEELVFKTVVEVPSAADSIETSPLIARVSYRRLPTSAGNQLVLDQQIYSTVPLAETQIQQTTIPADVKFSFAYSGDSEGQVLWQDVWIDTVTLPRGIKAELTFPSKKGPLRYESAFQIPQGAFPQWNR